MSGGEARQTIQFAGGVKIDAVELRVGRRCVVDVSLAGWLASSLAGAGPKSSGA